MVTFEQIQEANKSIKTTDIKGKEYAEVNQRIKAFRMVYPNGCIRTEIESLNNGICLMRAYITDENGKMIATGTAYEKEGSTFINKTSFIENAETSAIGRALGMAGFGIDTSVASKEEVENAIAQQEADKKVDAKTAKAFKGRCKGDAGFEAYILKGLNLKAWEEMTNDIAAKLNAEWKKIEQGYKK